MERSAREAEKDAVSAARLEALNLISDALDASEEGFAIWRAARAADGSVESFTQSLVNSTGADAAGRPDLSEGLLELGVKFAELVGAEVIVEKIETQEDLDLARKVGAKYAQGWLFGQPVDLSVPTPTQVK